MATPIDRAKAAYNFMPALHRPACRNCLHVLELGLVGQREGPRFQCRNGSFMVTAMAVCERHVFRAAGARA